MNVRVIPRTVVTGSLNLVRMPLDTAISLLPGNGQGVKPKAQLAVDRADATARSVAGAMLGDSVLLEDAHRRGQAADERQRGMRLRGRAEKTAEKSDARLRTREDKARKQRQQARERAKTRRQQAETQADARKQEAVKSETRRREASRTIAAEREEAIEEQVPREELQTLEAQTEAVRAREEELTARDEARRLAEAARKVNAERKSDV